MRFAFLVLAVLPVAVHAQTIRDSTISASATKTTRIAPDRASMYVLVEGSAETPADAVARVETKLKTVADALKGVGSRVEVDRSITFTVGPTPQPNMYPAPVVPPSNVSRAILRVNVASVDQVARVTATALAAGASSIANVTYESSIADSVRRARMTDALTVARADAQTLATALEGKLGPLVDVSTMAPNVGFQGPTAINFDGRYMGPSQIPEVVITSSVTVRYRLVR
jgi:uncharacterized protein YggE